MKGSKALVLYLYREDSKTVDNLFYFIRKGVSDTDSIDFVFIINDYKCSIKFPNFKNIRIIKKENSFDLNSYLFALKEYDISSYDKFIFLNSSCIGPILPVYAKECWVKLVTNQLDEKIKLVAPIVEIPRDSYGAQAIRQYKYISESDVSVPFLHTYMFATDKVGLNVLLEYGVLTDDKIEQFELVHTFERLISSCILNEGFSIKSLLKKYENVDLALKSNWNAKKWNDSDTKTCPEIPGNYDGIDVHPFELIFTKNIRRKHSFRSWRISGISRILRSYIRNYVKWTMT